MSRLEQGVVSPPEAIQMEGQSESSKRRSEAQKRWRRTDPQAEDRKAEMLRAREVRRKMREANPRLLTPATKADQKLWFYARTKDLIPEIIKTGNVEKEEIERLENFFEKKGTKDRLPEDLLVRFSTAVAWVAYDPLD